MNSSEPLQNITAYAYLRDKLNEWVQNLNEITQLVQDEGGARPVHRYRVSLRRLRSSMPFLIPFHGSYYPDYLRKAMGRLARATNQLRDNEVMLQILEDTRLNRDENHEGLTPFPELHEPAYHAWHKKIQTSVEVARANVRDSLTEGDLNKVLEELIALLKLPPRKKKKQSATDYGEFCVQRELKVVEHKLSRFARRSKKAVWLHDLRIDFKRLRYATDLFLPVLPMEHVDRMKFARKCQNRLGEIHDCDFIVDRLHKEHEIDEDVRTWFINQLQLDRELSLQKLMKRLLKHGYENIEPLPDESKDASQVDAPIETIENTQPAVEVQDNSEPLIILESGSALVEPEAMQNVENADKRVLGPDQSEGRLVIDDTIPEEDHIKEIEPEIEPASSDMFSDSPLEISSDDGAPLEEARLIIDDTIPQEEHLSELEEPIAVSVDSPQSNPDPASGINDEQPEPILSDVNLDAGVDAQVDAMIDVFAADDAAVFVETDQTPDDTSESENVNESLHGQFQSDAAADPLENKRPGEFKPFDPRL